MELKDCLYEIKQFCNKHLDELHLLVHNSINSSNEDSLAIENKSKEFFNSNDSTLFKNYIDMNNEIQERLKKIHKLTKG